MEDGRPRVVAQLGDPAPGGGALLELRTVAAVSATGAIGFAASVDDGPSPVIVVRTGREGLHRVVGVVISCRAGRGSPR